MLSRGGRLVLLGQPAVRLSLPPAAGVSFRGVATGSTLLRHDRDRVPAGHVRPRRRLPASSGRGPMPDDVSIPPAAQWESPPPPGGGYPQGPGFGFDGGLPPVPQSRPVYVPPDPNGVLNESHAAWELLAHDTLVVVRQLEMLNVFLGYEQANRYAIHTPEGDLVGFLAEEERSILSTLSRQALRTHRPFRSTVMDRHGEPILWIRRPFAFINSRIFVHASEDGEGRLVGEAQQEWHPWRRRYNVFQSRDTETFQQFARIDSGFLAWDFWLKGPDDRLIASINRNFRGLGRELFTDTGQYVVRFDSAGSELQMAPGSEINVQGQTLVLPEGKEGGLTLDQRAMALATAVSIDFDYFSRHSGSGGMGFPFMIWGGGDGSSDVNTGRGAGDVGASSGDVGGAAAGAAGAAAAGQYGQDRLPADEDEYIYGPQPGQDAPPPRPYDQRGWDAQSGHDDARESTYEPTSLEESPWWEQANTPEDVLEDPWAEEQGSGGDSWFDGGDGGDWV